MNSVANGKNVAANRINIPPNVSLFQNIAANFKRPEICYFYEALMGLFTLTLVSFTN